MHNDPVPADKGPRSLPLLPEGAATQIVAFRHGQAVTRATFLSDIAAVAARLPDARPVLNLCNDRYVFTVALLAAVSRGILSLLPNSVVTETIASVRAREPDLLCLSEQATAPFDLPHLHIDLDRVPAENCTAMPQIPADRIAVCVFTSGSTGTPQPHYKSYASIVATTAAEGRHLWRHTGGPCTLVGTVPFQHMYGLESTIFLAIMSGGMLSSARPFYPADIAAALAGIPAPRMLVTTPFHLRTLLEAQIELPALAGILCATAPLSRELATQAEAQLSAPLLEIYGATEVGQLATRRPTVAECWEVFADVHLTQQDGLTWASGGTLVQPTALGDVLEILDESHFNLLGRGSDMINVAGKRSSLAFLNNVILRVPGVRDAVFCMPFDDEAGRLAAFVVAPGVDAKTIRHSLRAYVDAVFLPRPIVFVDALPRNATGKLTTAALDELIATHFGTPHP